MYYNLHISAVFIIAIGQVFICNLQKSAMHNNKGYPIDHIWNLLNSYMFASFHSIIHVRYTNKYLYSVNFQIQTHRILNSSS